MSVPITTQEAREDLMATVNALVRHAMKHGETAVVCLPDDYSDEVDALIAAIRSEEGEYRDRLADLRRDHDHLVDQLAEARQQRQALVDALREVLAPVEAWVSAVESVTGETPGFDESIERARAALAGETK